jgi:6-phosphogluconolactonase
MTEPFDHQKAEESGKIYGFDEPVIEAPPLPGNVVVAPTYDELVDLVAADLCAQADECVRRFGDFHLALSGGRTPQLLYERLMYDPNFRRLPWRRTHVWLVEERGVPLDDPASSCLGISETIGDHSDIPPEQFHPIDAQSATADADYESQIREALAWREKGHDRLDFILLILGANGETAGLFPGDDALDEEMRLMRRVFQPNAEPAERVTMTFPLINSARFVGIMASGPKRADVIDRLAHGRESKHELPAKGVQPVGGELRWYLDAEACGAPTGA